MPRRVIKVFDLNRYKNKISFFYVAIMSFILGLFIGCGVGAVGHRYWQQSSFNNSYSELMEGEKNNEITELFEHYPYLMNLIKSNLNDPEYNNIREFFVVDPSAIMNSSVPRLRYDLSDEMRSLLDRLEEYEYIEQLEHDSLLYRMEDDFVDQVLSFVKTTETEHCENLTIN